MDEVFIQGDKTWVACDPYVLAVQALKTGADAAGNPITIPRLEAAFAMGDAMRLEDLTAVSAKQPTIILGMFRKYSIGFKLLSNWQTKEFITNLQESDWVPQFRALERILGEKACMTMLAPSWGNLRASDLKHTSRRIFGVMKALHEADMNSWSHLWQAEGVTWRIAIPLSVLALCVSLNYIMYKLGEYGFIPRTVAFYVPVIIQGFLLMMTAYSSFYVIHQYLTNYTSVYVPLNFLFGGALWFPDVLPKYGSLELSVIVTSVNTAAASIVQFGLSFRRFCLKKLVPVKVTDQVEVAENQEREAIRSLIRRKLCERLQIYRALLKLSHRSLVCNYTANLSVDVAVTATDWAIETLHSGMTPGELAQNDDYLQSLGISPERMDAQERTIKSALTFFFVGMAFALAANFFGIGAIALATSSVSAGIVLGIVLTIFTLNATSLPSYVDYYSMQIGMLTMGVAVVTLPSEISKGFYSKPGIYLVYVTLIAIVLNMFILAPFLYFTEKLLLKVSACLKSCCGRTALEGSAVSEPTDPAN